MLTPSLVDGISRSPWCHLPEATLLMPGSPLYIAVDPWLREPS